jgi:hypothetical protein
MAAYEAALLYTKERKSIDKRIKELIVEALQGATVICEQQDNIYGKLELSEWWDSDEETK